MIIARLYEFDIKCPDKSGNNCSERINKYKQELQDTVGRFSL